MIKKYEIGKMRLQHVAFICEDIKLMEEYYSKVFGFKRVKTFNNGKKNEFFILRRDDVRIELFPKKEEKSYGDWRFKHFAISVDSIDAIINYLESMKIKVDKIIDYSTNENKFKICFITDPEGNVIEFMEGYMDDNK